MSDREVDTRAVKLSKMGMRVLGISESFKRSYKHSVLCGTVMRGDLQVDGVSLAHITVGGLDATDGVIEVFERLNREDINIIMLNGCVVSWFNIIDLGRVHGDLGLPVICVTYEDSLGLEEHFRKYFEGDNVEERLELYSRLGERSRFKLHTNYEILARVVGMDEHDAHVILNRFTLHGKIPEPLRVASLIARAVLRSNFHQSN